MFEPDSMDKKAEDRSEEDINAFNFNFKYYTPMVMTQINQHKAGIIPQKIQAD